MARTKRVVRKTPGARGSSPSSAAAVPLQPERAPTVANLHGGILRDIINRLPSATALAPPPRSSTKPPPALERATTVADLTDDTLRDIIARLPPVDLLRAALACHRWRRTVARCIPDVAPPLLGYFFHPAETPPPPPFPEPMQRFYPSVFAPLDASTPRLGLAFALPGASNFTIYDVHLGLVVLLPTSLPKGLLPRLLVVDPASRRRELLPQPPRDALPDDRWRRTRHFVGAAVLSRAHPSKLCFDAVCLTIDGGHPRAWVASFRDGECSWRALPQEMDVKVEFDPYWFEGRCVHAAGDIYWHICNSNRMLKLDPATLRFSYLEAPADVPTRFYKFRIGEAPEDGQLAIAAVEDQAMLFYVRGDAKWSDNGWLLQKHMDMSRVFDTVPGLPRDKISRVMSTWLGDIDPGHTGKLFIRTTGYGHLSFHMETCKLERMTAEDGKDYGHPVYAYYLAWPPAFLATEH